MAKETVIRRPKKWIHLLCLSEGYVPTVPFPSVFISHYFEKLSSCGQKVMKTHDVTSCDESFYSPYRFILTVVKTLGNDLVCT